MALVDARSKLGNKERPTVGKIETHFRRRGRGSGSGSGRSSGGFERVGESG